MRIIRGLAALLIAVLALLPAGPAHAVNPTADLDPAASTLRAPLGRETEMRATIHNYGPQWAIAFTIDITAPGGTVFGADILHQLGGMTICEFASSNRRIRCKVQYSIPPDGSQVDHGPHVISFPLKAIDKCPTPGRLKIDYKYDPKLSNNSTSLVVRVNGVDPKVCQKPKPSPSVKPAPTPAAVVSASASPSAEVTEPIAESTSPEPVLVAEPQAASDSGMSTVGFIIGGIAVLLGGALLAAALLRGRDRTLADELSDEGAGRAARFDGQNSGL